MPSPPDFSPSPEERRALLQYARHVVESAVRHSSFSAVSEDPIFSAVRGVFVTIHAKNKLRGCIGVVEAAEPLRSSIAHCATGAALHDPRFLPVRPEELEHLEIEISLLSPPTPIQPADIALGKHGLIVVSDRRRGLLLPQVAAEHQLDREEFLAETCHKAGLPRDAWKSSAVQILGFTCEVFSDRVEASPK
ncbi:MAG: AmmeMemoRadiSam system protein A [Acidobacteria bacterium]|nr:AmmeMemoRadiSam system protein A [Acidobacteriota bacterium]MBS1865135.1 AmmeMemoRadiSam system protein A [Acidobacteriota bacterium]